MSEKTKKPKKTNLKNQHRDTMFRGYFKKPENFLHLHKHCSGQDSMLTADDIKPFDLESAVAVRIRRNDVSFITKDNRLIILIEHQSTINPNMALRLFLYYIELLQLWIKLNGINLYGKVKIEDLPIPEIYVVYNGADPLKEEVSEFYKESASILIKATVNIIDIHYDKLQDTEPDNALAGYSYFYKAFDESKEMGLAADESFSKAREECIAHGYLKGFIEREEFVMFYKDILDYDTQLKEEGKIEGREEGEAIGEARGKKEGINILAELIKSGHTLEEALTILDKETAATA